MEKINAKHYEVCYDEKVKSCVVNSIGIAEKGRITLNKLFDCDDDLMILKASYFSNRDDFVNHIKSISGGNQPPNWASGCFYNNEIQVYVNVKNEKEVKFKEHTLLHETVHLYFDNYVYKKYDIPRVRWLDESFATYLDGSQQELSLQDLKNTCKNIKIEDFDMNILDDIEKVKTERLNGYDAFKIIGYYIFNRHIEKEMLDTLKSDFKKIRLIGKDILKKSIDFILKM